MFDKRLGESEDLNCWHMKGMLPRKRQRVALKGLKETINWWRYHSAQSVMHNLILQCVITIIIRAAVMAGTVFHLT